MSKLIFYDLKRVPTMSLSLSVQVARELGRRIVSGALEPGRLLDDENALSERFRVSRVVIRDAVKILVSKGMLIVEGMGEQNDLFKKYPLLLRDMVREMEEWSWDNVQPRWFHISAEGAGWRQAGMPRFDQTFSID